MENVDLKMKRDGGREGQVRVDRIRSLSGGVVELEQQWTFMFDPDATGNYRQGGRPPIRSLIKIRRPYSFFNTHWD